MTTSTLLVLITATFLARAAGPRASLFFAGMFGLLGLVSLIFSTVI